MLSIRVQTIFAALMILMIVGLVSAPGFAQGRQPVLPSGRLLESPRWTADSDEPGAILGLPLASAGDVNGDGFADVIVSASAFDQHWIDEGAVFAYYGSRLGLPESPSWSAYGERSRAQFGASISPAGDVNGDGYADVIVGAPNFQSASPLQEEGAAYIFLGSSQGLEGTACWATLGNQLAAHFGNAVASAGDVNGDGYSDVIVAAREFDSDQLNEGRVFMFLGSPAGPSVSPNWMAEGNQANAAFGFSISTAGDVNGDGFDDVLISSALHGGEFCLYLGLPNGLSSNPAATIASFGNFAVGPAGDVNKDGFGDVAIADVSYSNGEQYEGRASVFLGSSTGLVPSPSWTFETNQASAGVTVAASAGDVNRDGFDDLVVGSSAFSNHGRAFLFLGSGTGLNATPICSIETDQIGASFGYSASAGDIDGDGFVDVLIGAPGYNNGEELEGQAFAYSWFEKIQPRSPPDGTASVTR